jgi:hypothetical protein
MPDSLLRLRAANPARVDEDHGSGPVAQAALERILADPGPSPAPASAQRRRLPRGLTLVLTAMLLGAGAAAAATDPFGWWSPNPGTAKFGINPARRVPTPTAQKIACRRRSSGGFLCEPRGSGQHYMRIDAIQPPQARSLFSRTHFNAAISQQLAAGKITAAVAARFRADVARVPDSFFTELRLASNFVTYGAGQDGTGRELVPPIGIPSLLVCEDAGPALTCQDLNGDQHAPVGAGIYQAQQTAGWRTAPPHRRDFALPPGISSFTTAEYRLLRDLATGSGSSGSSTRSSSSSAGRGQAAHQRACLMPTRHC